MRNETPGTVYPPIPVASDRLANPPRFNSFFRKALATAKHLAQSADRLLDLVEQASQKLEKADHRGPLKTVLADAGALFRLLRAYAKRHYTAIPWESLVLVVAAIIYFVWPIDLIPDFIPGIGYMDDAAVISFVVLSIQSELAAFRQWEKYRRYNRALDRPYESGVEPKIRQIN